MSPGPQRLTAAFNGALSDAGLTQEHLADKLGVHQTTVSKWIVGKAQVPLQHLPAIDELCGKPRGHILRLAGYVSDDIDLLAAIRTDPTLDEDGRQHVVSAYEYCRSHAKEPAEASYGPINEDDPDVQALRRLEHLPADTIDQLAAYVTEVKAESGGEASSRPEPGDADVYRLPWR
jgi:hypothetical protein